MLFVTNIFKYVIEIVLITWFLSMIIAALLGKEIVGDDISLEYIMLLPVSHFVRVVIIRKFNNGQQE